MTPRLPYRMFIIVVTITTLHITQYSTSARTSAAGQQSTTTQFHPHLAVERRPRKSECADSQCEAASLRKITVLEACRFPVRPGWGKHTTPHTTEDKAFYGFPKSGPSTLRAVVEQLNGTNSHACGPRCIKASQRRRVFFVRHPIDRFVSGWAESERHCSGVASSRQDHRSSYSTHGRNTWSRQDWGVWHNMTRGSLRHPHRNDRSNARSAASMEHRAQERFTAFVEAFVVWSGDVTSISPPPPSLPSWLWPLWPTWHRWVSSLSSTSTAPLKPSLFSSSSSSWSSFNPSAGLCSEGVARLRGHLTSQMQYLCGVQVQGLPSPSSASLTASPRYCGFDFSSRGDYIGDVRTMSADLRHLLGVDVGLLSLRARSSWRPEGAEISVQDPKPFRDVTRAKKIKRSRQQRREGRVPSSLAAVSQPPSLPVALLPHVCALYRDDFCCLGYAVPPECKGMCSSSSTQLPSSGSGGSQGEHLIPDSEYYRSMKHWVVQPASKAGVVVNSSTTMHAENTGHSVESQGRFWSLFRGVSGHFLPWYGVLAMVVAALTVISANRTEVSNSSDRRRQR